MIFREKKARYCSEYLPKQLSDEETKKICSDIVSFSGASSIKDMGRVMGEFKKTCRYNRFFKE